MGMFDYVDCPEISCPGCGGDLYLQSKQGKCVMETTTLPELMKTPIHNQRGRDEVRMIGSCDNCRWWVHVEIETGNNPVDVGALQRALKDGS